LFAVALGLQSRNGADFGRYSQWPKAFSSSNILKLQSVTLSPVGVPTTQWSHAPGLITDAIERTLSIVPALKIGLPTAAWLAAIAFWWAMIGLVRLVTRGDPLLFALTLAVAFIGTHAGFYSIFVSSEIFSLAGFAVAAFWVLSSGPERVRDSLIIGVACGLLLSIRVNLASYVLLPLVTRAIAVFRGHGSRPNKAVAFHALALGVPLLVYVAQLSFFNYWMTGNPSKSPYVFGDGTFRSIDLAHPLFGTALFHSWHGLLSYHPLFLLGAIALGALAVRRDLPQFERILAGSALLALLAQLYLQASWWCWWSGTGTFGNRTLAVGGVLVVLALARWLLILQQDGTRRSLTSALVLLGLTAASCFWSFLLYLQGHANYVNWQELLHEQRQTLSDPSVFVPVLVAMLMGLGFAVSKFGTLRSRAVFAAVTGSIGALATHGLLVELVRSQLTALGLERWMPALLGLVVAIAFTVIVWLASDGSAALNPIRRARTAVAGGLLCVFIVGAWSFGQLAIATQSVIADATAKPRSFRYRSSMVMDELTASIEEYDRVEGFEARKRVARRFIEAAALDAHRKIAAP
jgi:hypothetical protein